MEGMARRILAGRGSMMFESRVGSMRSSGEVDD